MPDTLVEAGFIKMNMRVPSCKKYKYAVRCKYKSWLWTMRAVSQMTEEGTHLRKKRASGVWRLKLCGVSEAKNINKVWLEIRLRR